MAKSDRKVAPVKGDGNCFFRALSYQLFGKEELHSTVRLELYRVENRNQEIFQQHVTEGISIAQHLNTLLSPSSWETQVEVVAAASLFNIPLYYCTEENSTYKWNVIKPLTDKHFKPLVICPLLTPLDDSIELLRPEHFELLYVTNTHYNAIVSSTTGGVFADHPVLSNHTSIEPTIL